MHDILKEIPPEVINAIRVKITEVNTQKIPDAYKDRFKGNAQRLAETPDDKGGVDIVMTNENGNVMVDFGQPVQLLGLTIDDAQILMNMLTGCLKVAMLEDLLKTHDGKKPN